MKSRFLILLAAAMGAQAQMIDDGIMMGKGLLCTGYMYTHDSWDEYWEGARKRSNGNIGKLTTQTNQYFANYGVTNSLNVITHLPHVRTEASQGVLAGMRGWQDATIAVKYKLLDTPFTEAGSFRVMAAVSAGLPMTDYTPDFLPLSIGLNSRRLSGRLTTHFRGRNGLFVQGTAAHTWRDDVKLDRPFYYTDGRLTFSDRVAMPKVVDYAFSSGLIRGEMVLSASFTEQRTLGGGDIRRQDMPFVSNRMNFQRVGGWAKVPLPKFNAISVVGGYSYVIGGRNVGQSSTITAGIVYLFSFRTKNFRGRI